MVLPADDTGGFYSNAENVCFNVSLYVCVCICVNVACACASSGEMCVGVLQALGIAFAS